MDVPLLKLSVLWTCCLLLAPILLVQAILARKTIPRLPEAAPPNRGRFGNADRSIQVLGIGDSVIAGVGCDTLSQSVTASVARILHERMSRCVEWSAYGCNGDRIKDVIEKLAHVPASHQPILIVSAGVNDVTGLISLMRWQLYVTTLAGRLKERFGGPVVFLGVPPMGKFTGLPQPLRFVLGIRSRMLDHVLKRAAALIEGTHWIDTAESFDPTLLASDGYHPSTRGCARLAACIADEIAPLVEQTFAADELTR